MRMLMPSHARKVQLWPDQGQSLFARYQVESQLDAMLSPTVQLRSGGYLVINQAEALVAIDVNSGRSTRERNVEETALRTNLEASDEVARQLRCATSPVSSSSTSSTWSRNGTTRWWSAG